MRGASPAAQPHARRPPLVQRTQGPQPNARRPAHLVRRLPRRHGPLQRARVVRCAQQRQQLRQLARLLQLRAPGGPAPHTGRGLRQALAANGRPAASAAAPSGPGGAPGPAAPNPCAPVRVASGAVVCEAQGVCAPRHLGARPCTCATRLASSSGEPWRMRVPVLRATRGQQGPRALPVQPPPLPARGPRAHADQAAPPHPTPPPLPHLRSFLASRCALRPPTVEGAREDEADEAAAEPPVPGAAVASV
jgi:hypothetical protein